MMANSETKTHYACVIMLSYSDLNYVGHEKIHIGLSFYYQIARIETYENSRNRNVTQNDSVLIRIKCL